MPAGTQYDIHSSIGSEKTIFKSRGAIFNSSYRKYDKTCDIQKNIKIYNANADSNVRGVGSYDIDAGIKAVKKRVPSYS